MYLTVLIAQSGFELVYAKKLHSTVQYYLPTDTTYTATASATGGTDKSTESSQLLGSLEGAKAFVPLYSFVVDGWPHTLYNWPLVLGAPFSLLRVVVSSLQPL